MAELVSKPEELRKRTKAFAYRIIRLFRALPKTPEAQVIGRQLLRSGTGVAANYRAVCRARTKAEFTAKIGIVVEESDESVFWTEALADNGIVPAKRVQGLLDEGCQLTAIFTASQQTARRR